MRFLPRPPPAGAPVAEKAITEAEKIFFNLVDAVKNKGIMDKLDRVTGGRLSGAYHEYKGAEVLEDGGSITARFKTDTGAPAEIVYIKLFRLAIRSSTALASHETVLGSAVPSPATPPAPCCFQIIRSGLQQVRFLRKLMPGKGFYMDVLCYLLKAWKRCAVPAAIASC